MRGHAHSRTFDVARTGSSGAAVRIVQRADGTSIAIKTARNPRVSAFEQARARDSIAPFFGHLLPEVLFAGVRHGIDTLVTECPTTDTLADIAAANGPRALSSWYDVAATLTRIWSRSARPGFDPASATRKHELRQRRALEGIAFTWQSLGYTAEPWRHLVINDVDYGPIDKHVGHLATVPPPRIHVACQGDPQPRNILLASTGRWYLVDWEWAGLHQDWRMMTSHLIGWWYTDHILRATRGTIRPTRHAVIVTYDPPQTPSLSRWIIPAAEAFRRMTDSNSFDDDCAALALHLAMLLIRELPAAVRSGRTQLIAPLVGESIQLVESARSGSAHRLLTSVADRTHQHLGSAT